MTQIYIKISNIVTFFFRLPPINGKPMCEPNNSLREVSPFSEQNPCKNVKLPDVIERRHRQDEGVTILGELNRQQLKLKRVKRHFRDLNKAAGLDLNVNRHSPEKCLFPTLERVIFE